MSGLSPTATAAGDGVPEVTLSQAWSLLRRGLSGRGQFLLLVACLVCLAAAVAIAFTGSGSKGTIGATVATAFGVGLLWSSWFARLLLLRIEAHTARLPGLARAIPAALGLAIVASVVLPAAALVMLVGAEPGLTLSALVLAAAAAMLLAMLPGGAYMALCFAPLVFMVLVAVVRRVFPDLSFDMIQLLAPGRIPWLALLATLLAAWRWRALVRRADDLPTSPWRRPVVLASRPGALWGGFNLADASQWQGELPDWMWPAGQTGHAGPEQPVRAMRAILGTPFAPLSRSQLAIQIGIIPLALVLLAFSTGDGFEGELARVLEGGLMGGLAGGGMVLVAMFGWRLDVLRQRPSAELAELALLPGWGDVPQMRRLVLRAAGTTPMRSIALGTAVLLGVAAYAGVGIAGLAGLLVAALGTGLVMVLGSLRPLVGKPMAPLWMMALIGLVMILLVITAGAAIRPAWAAVWPWVLAGWAVAYLVCATGIATEWRRFHARAHPFLPG